MASLPRSQGFVIGQVFGNWEIIGSPRMENFGSQRYTVYPCRCKCGTLGDVKGNRLASGKAMSCGCRRRARIFEVGERFGRLVIDGTPIAIKAGKHNARAYPCVCDCGTKKNVREITLKQGDAVSCGCYHRDEASARHKTHGMSGSRLYRIWTHMKRRCSEPKEAGYEYYGAKGITVCPEWEESFAAFRDWALTHGYADDLTIDRVKSSKNYEPENCQWIPRPENTLKSIPLRYLTAFGETKYLSDWTRDPRCAVAYMGLVRRLANGWEPEPAITLPPYARSPRGKNNMPH